MASRIHDSDFQIDKIPDTCPGCEKGIEPIKCYAHGINTWRRHEGFLQIVYRCPREDCNRLFIAKYLNSSSIGNTLRLQRSYLLDYFELETFSSYITKISPIFSDIYNESKIAEDNGLKLIAGPGYRKALEFLVKDYLISINPNAKDEIQQKKLGSVIKMIEEKRIEACASRAAWVGNDETHYIRKWADRDVTDLKNLIKMVVDWIDLVERSNEYEQAMPSEAPPETD